MLTLHAKRGRTSIVLLEQASVTVQDLIVELAEVLVATNELSNKEVAALRLALEAKDGWQALEADQTLTELGITDSSVVGFATGTEEFGYDVPSDYIE